MSLTAPLNHTISEERIVSSFHILAKAALLQAVQEGLLDAEELANAHESETQILGPSLVLFFAAIQADEGEPTLLIPSSPPARLSASTCPIQFQNLFALWSRATVRLKQFPSEARHDVARLCCDKRPLSESVPQEAISVFVDLRAVALEISQRRSFLERYQDDLQAVLDQPSTLNRSGSLQAHFKPPPIYEGSDHGPPDHPPSNRRPLPTPGTTQRAEDPHMLLIRETLYAALADVIASTPSLAPVLQTDPARAYFACVALAILSVGLQGRTSDGKAIRVVDVGLLVHESLQEKRSLASEEVPQHMQPIIGELLHIGHMADEFAEVDDRRAMQAAANDNFEELGQPTRMERLRWDLERGANWDEQEVEDDDRSASPTSTVRSLANRINRLALDVTSLPAFRDRATHVFQILASFASR